MMMMIIMMITLYLSNHNHSYRVIYVRNITDPIILSCSIQVTWICYSRLVSVIARMIVLWCLHVNAALHQHTLEHQQYDFTVLF